MDIEVPHGRELFIGSRWVQPHGTELAEVVAPFTGKTVAQLPRPSVEDARDAVEGAVASFGAWRDLTLEERHEVVARFCAGLDKRIDDIVATWALEAGMPHGNGLALTTDASCFGTVRSTRRSLPRGSRFGIRRWERSRCATSRSAR